MLATGAACVCVCVRVRAVPVFVHAHYILDVVGVGLSVCSVCVLLHVKSVGYASQEDTLKTFCLQSLLSNEKKYSCRIHEAAYNHLAASKTRTRPATA